MGSSESKAAESKANRIARWRSTGIVALREAKLKASKPFLFIYEFLFLLFSFIYNLSI